MRMWKTDVARVAFAVVVALTAGCGGSGNAGNGGGSPDLGGGTGGGGDGPQTILNVYVTWYGFNDNS
jgi:hypothetical protein